MKIDIDFFKTTARALQGKFLNALEAAKRAVTVEVAKYLPRIITALSRFYARFRERNFLEDSRDRFEKFVARGKNKGEDLLFWLRENAFLKDSGIFFKDTYARVVVRRQYTRRDLIALFIIAVILGAGLKSVATGTVTIGFDDYTLTPEETLYDLNALQQKLIDEGGGLTGSSVAEGEACSE